MTHAQHYHASPSLEPLSDKPIELPFSPGEIIGGKYEVGELIGAGGMGFVVAAKHVDLRESVALKFLRREALAHEELVMRFATEARAAVRIKSEYVARVFDVGALPDGVPFIVMEHLVGKDLCQHLHEEGQLPVRVAVEYVMQACEALAAAHSIGIVHRDVKPENLFLTERAQGMHIVKVLDFGISKVALTGSAFDHKPLARTMMPMGSPVYMSPEQIRASEEIDARTDIWSLGCVLYELLTGVPAFDAPSLTQLSATILEKDPIPISQLAPEVPPELEAVVLRCLEKNRDARYRNVAELAIALYRFAPRRARIFAERCATLLSESSNGALEFELPSVAPP
ncbi:MAG TPA: serine/threonine-protein kinase, partial [Polyangiaceae bacterium]|nr:serine/threonine-protein kinase [Polyangiaceae bacterium]